MKYQFFTLDVFAEQKFEGNQLAVIPNAESLDERQMQKIAQEFNYSETVFITQGDSEHSWDVRIFTPTSENHGHKIQMPDRRYNCKLEQRKLSF